MSCADLERWLDEGMPRVGEGPALRHAATCPRCAPALAAARELDAVLERAAYSPPAAPAALLGGVMERVVAGAQGAPRPTRAAALPRWLQVLSDPAVAAGLVAAALGLAGPGALRALLSGTGPQLSLGGAWLGRQVTLLASHTDALLSLGLWLGLAPLLGLASVALFQIAQAALIAGRANPGRPRGIHTG